MKNTELITHGIVSMMLNPAIENCSAQLSAHGGCQIEQVSVRPKNLFSLTPIEDITCANELHSKPGCYIHVPSLKFIPSPNQQ